MYSNKFQRQVPVEFLKNVFNQPFLMYDGKELDPIEAVKRKIQLNNTNGKSHSNNKIETSVCIINFGFI